MSFLDPRAEGLFRSFRKALQPLALVAGRSLSALRNGGDVAATALDAAALATAQMESQCGEGYSLDPGSIVMDVTLIPTGVCDVGYFGTFIAEASGFGCCCPDAVPNEAQSWGCLLYTSPSPRD